MAPSGATVAFLDFPPSGTPGGLTSGTTVGGVLGEFSGFDFFFDSPVVAFGFDYGAFNASIGVRLGSTSTLIGIPGPLPSGFFGVVSDNPFSAAQLFNESTVDSNFSIDNITLSVVDDASRLPGDFNQDGDVDAADYTLWRDTLNLEGEGLAADANGDGFVNQQDYQLWADNFGATLAGAAAPEPMSLVLLGLTLSAGHCMRSRSGFGRAL